MNPIDSFALGTEPKSFSEQMILDLYAEGKYEGHEIETEESLARLYISRFGKVRYEFLREQWPGEGMDLKDLSVVLLARQEESTRQITGYNAYYKQVISGGEEQPPVPLTFQEWLDTVYNHVR